MSTEKYRNVAIIAHVDHGKTTLVDKMLREGGAFSAREEVEERAMDSMDLEREKGITIKAKNASIGWKGFTINIVDTPGHADFGGEVERIMKMVDGVLLVVDAVDGPQAQTRFVLQKALHHGLKPIVVVNKIDREHANPDRVHDQVLELLLDLHATEEQFNCPFIFASARDGFAIRHLDDERVGMAPLLDLIAEVIPPPVGDIEAPFQMLVSNLDWSDFVGRIAIGRITAGRVDAGDSIVCIHRNGKRERAKVTKVFAFSGMRTEESANGEAGNIVGISGFEDLDIGETLCDNESREPIPFVELDPPTIQMQFCVNDGPLAGREGKFLTSRQLRERLYKETRTNISLSVQDTDVPNIFLVSARGELQIAVLVEQMRREGFEMLVSRPEVIMKRENGQKLEPFETLWVDTPQDRLGDLMQNLAGRKAQITDMQHHGDPSTPATSRVHLQAVIPTRGLIGFETDMVNVTSGRAVMSHIFKEYAPHCGPVTSRLSGTLVSMDKGVATAFALDTLQERGKLFIMPGDEVYEGMIVGENPRAEDIPVNPTKEKHLTNMRSQGEGKGIMLEPPRKFSLEAAIEYIAQDEFVEATPISLRLRKKVLNATQRKRANQRVSDAD
ncbi:MAG: translational GTPase TypA [Kiritimatiellae bacterium]|nr:translational GTPase TypA [Kiritimatiellia bacterium]MCO5044529.1 translational GTPase TypA [Kiritimatiellia bacterium]MCO5061560.1 translational GTPase TypA [Kiritimatiellia bacterium]MCO5067345.1 translational GTPase TypA [Kiritimatiellia bacterium]